MKKGEAGNIGERKKRNEEKKGVGLGGREKHANIDRKGKGSLCVETVGRKIRMKDKQRETLIE